MDKLEKGKWEIAKRMAYAFDKLRAEGIRDPRARAEVLKWGNKCERKLKRHLGAK